MAYYMVRNTDRTQTRHYGVPRGPYTGPGVLHAFIYLHSFIVPQECVKPSVYGTYLAHAKHEFVLAQAAHILKLERYRED